MIPMVQSLRTQPLEVPSKRAAPASSSGRTKKSQQTSCDAQPPPPKFSMDSATAHANSCVLVDSDRMMSELCVLEPFVGMTTSDALTIAAGASKAPFDIEDYKQAKGSCACYEAGGNCSWINVIRLPSCSVLSPAKIDALVNFDFPSPRNLPAGVSFVVSVGSDEDVLATHAAGNLTLISPPEMAIAMVRAAHRDRDDPIKRDAWHRIFLSVLVRWEWHDNADDMIFRRCQLREDLRQHHVSMSATVLSKILEVGSFKSRHHQTDGQIADSDIAATFLKHVNFAQGSEKVTNAFEKMPAMCTPSCSMILIFAQSLSSVTSC